MSDDISCVRRLACVFVNSWQGGIIMAGSGQQVGENVLIVYNDSPSPHIVNSLGVGSSSSASSEWIVPGYYYPPRQLLVLILLCIDVGERGGVARPPPKKIEKKIFSGNYHVKFGNFQANITQNSGILLIK